MATAKKKVEKEELVATVVREKEVRTDFLENKIVSVKYILKEGNGIKDPKHVAHGGLLNGAEIAIPAPTMDNGKMKNLLTDREKNGLESLLDGVNLSIYGSFWKERDKDGKRGVAYEMGILPIFLGKDELRLDISDPYDFIKLKLLQACPIVANSLDEINHRATNRFVLTSASEQMAKEIDKVGNKVQAYKLYVKYEESKQILRYTLRNLGRTTNRSHKLDFLQSELHKELEKNPSLLVSIMGDEYLKSKVLLESCYEYGAIVKKDKKFYTLDNEPVSDGDAPYLDVASRYLSSNLGQEMRLALEAKLKHLEE
ncbi:hypothetical protein [Clostridium sp.]|jgi:hypothetical protein|uniref:hypothetical protein n=1 Tax=Clostridium sp. TaxID=1506 RepID=UPI003EE92A56